MAKNKRCTKCGKRKLLVEFCKNKSTKDGLSCCCKGCAGKHWKKYQQIHKKEIAKYQKKYRQTHKDVRIKYLRKYRKTIMGDLRTRFRGIKQRCDNPKATRYENYGDRGIKCLFKSSNEFIDYVINELKIDPRGLQIDRINNDGHYEKGNIRFVTAKVNANNRRKRK